MKPYPYLLALLLTASACKKDKTELEKLPDATQNGSGGVGFLLDGHAWLPQASKLLGSGSAVSAAWRRTKTGRALQVGFSRDEDGSNAGFFIPHVTQPGSYQLTQRADITLGDRNPAYAGYMMTKSLTVPRLFLTGPTATGSVTVTRFDTIAHIVSGTFEMTVQEDKSLETHQLTQGRFDLRF